MILTGSWPRRPLAIAAVILAGLVAACAAPAPVEPLGSTGRPSTTTPRPPSGGTADCGEASCAPRADLPGWRHVFADDFSTDIGAGSFPAATRGRWGAYGDGWVDSSRRGRYQGSAIHVDDGTLRLPLRTVNGVPRVAAAYPIVPGAPGRNGGQVHGRFAIRVRADPIPGYKFVSVLWPDSGRWPHDGEIDFPEGDLNGEIMAFTHRQGAVVGSDQDWFRVPARWNDFHTYVIEWTSTSVTYLLDGRVIGRSTQRLPTALMYWVLQAETSLQQAVIPAWASGEVEVDWVSIWARS